MSQKSLRTARLELRPVGAGDLQYTKQVDMDNEVMKGIEMGRAYTEEEAVLGHEWLMSMSTSVAGLGGWLGFEAASGEFVGWWILAPFPSTAEKPEDFIRSKSEYGFRVATKFWGKGFAKEGAKEMLRHAFEDLELEEVIGETMTVNKASRAVMEANGLKHVDTWFNTYEQCPPGIEEGEVRYSITREDWLKMA